MSKRNDGDDPPSNGHESKNWDSLGGAGGGYYYFDEKGECRLYDTHPAAEWNLLDDTDHKMLRLLLKTPGLTVEYVASIFEVTRESANRRLSALRKGAWLLAEKKGVIGYHVSEKAKLAIRSLPPSESV